MKNKKGFTLIELLAIIVILAIIAVITVPIILNIIENSKRGAASDSAYGYKDAIDKFYATKLTLDSDYNIPDDDYTTEQLKNLGVSVSGHEPEINSWVTIEKNNITTGCLQYDEYKVDIEDGKVGNVEKGNCEIPVSSFANDPWEKIKAKLTANRNAYPIGSEKIVKMNLEGTEKDYVLRLSNTASCDNNWKGSKTACGVVIEFVTTLGSRAMNSTSTNWDGWYASSMRTYLNTGDNSIYNKLKIYLGENTIITTSPVISGSGSSGTSTNAEDYLYLLSGREVGLDLPKDNKKNTTTDTKTLQYYSINNNNNARIKYTTSERTTKSWSWLRTPVSDRNDLFYGVDEAGWWSNQGAKYSKDVAPAFRILN